MELLSLPTHTIARNNDNLLPPNECIHLEELVTFKMVCLFFRSLLVRLSADDFERHKNCFSFRISDKWENMDYLSQYSHNFCIFHKLTPIQNLSNHTTHILVRIEHKKTTKFIFSFSMRYFFLLLFTDFDIILTQNTTIWIWFQLQLFKLNVLHLLLLANCNHMRLKDDIV